MIACEVLLVLVPVGSLFLLHQYDAIPDTQRCASKLPTAGQGESKQPLSSSEPDITIGIKLKQRGQAIDEFADIITLVICRLELIYPLFIHSQNKRFRECPFFYAQKFALLRTHTWFATWNL